MSIYGYLNCHDCKKCIWLGKALHKENIPFAYHIGSADQPKHWKREMLNKVIWKFLADHTGHNIDVRLEYDMPDDEEDYQEIGGDSDKDVTFSDYLVTESGYYTNHE